jgi:hypothetical protein
MTSDQGPTYMDHHYLNFWLWACLHDGEAYLAASAAVRSISAEFRSTAIAGKPMPDIRRTFNERRIAAQQHMELEKYHFVTAVGSLLRNLKRSQELFPSIKPVCDKAQHLFAEGKLLRDMIEHSDAYIERKGHKQANFVREAEGVATNLPGDAPGIADATSTIVDENGHWLGGRLNVERVIAEVRIIAEEAAQIRAPSPTTSPHPSSRAGGLPTPFSPRIAA